MTRKFILLSALIWFGVLLCLPSHAQEHALRGVVLNEDRVPVGGVQVTVDGLFPVISTPAEGRFQMNLPSAANPEELEVVISATGYRLKTKRYDARRKELELIIQPISKTLGGWVRTAGKEPISGVMIKFRNGDLERTVTTDRDGFFRIQMPSETVVTLADFAVESYKVDNGNIELRKVQDDNLKFIHQNTFVFLTVSPTDQLIGSEEPAKEPGVAASTDARAEDMPNKPARQAARPNTAWIKQKDPKLHALIELVGTKRKHAVTKTNYLQVIEEEVKLISQEFGRLQKSVSAAKSEKEKEAAEAAFNAYINDPYISAFIELLRKTDPDNPLAALLEKYQRENKDMSEAKKASDFRLGEITRLFKVSVFSAVALFVLGGISVFFGLSNYRKKKELQEATEKLGAERRQLEILNEELKTLMGIVAHDLKAPLNKVVGLTQLLPLVGALNEEQTKYLGMVNQVTHDGRRFIENLLDLKAIEEDKRHYSPEPVEIISWMRRSIVGYEQAAQKKNIQLHLLNNLDEGWINVDKTAFGQVIDNLVSNAIKFSYLDKSVCIQIEVGYSLVSIAVKDQGPGISEEDQQRMFRKFQRLSARPTAGEHSSGLGLSIVKRLIEQMDGEVNLESTVGEGSTFTVFFHKYKMEETAPELTQA